MSDINQDNADADNHSTHESFGSGLSEREPQKKDSEVGKSKTSERIENPILKYGGIFIKWVGYGFVKWIRHDRINLCLAILTFCILIYYSRLYKQSAKQFETINEPLLAVGGGIGLSNWQNIDSFSIITFWIHNISTKAILIEKCIYGLRCDTTDTKNIFSERDTTNVFINPSPEYISTKIDYPKVDKFDRIFKNNPITKKSFADGINTFFGVIFYRDYLTGNRKYYIFSARIAPDTELSGLHRLAQTYLTSNTYELPLYKSKKYKEFVGSK
jgi:hypothetical protein